MHCDPIGQL